MRSKGFTLVELLVAIGITVIILSFLFPTLLYSFNIAQTYIHQNLKQTAYSQIYNNLGSLRNAINISPDYDNSRLWYQLPAQKNKELALPPQNGSWYYLELQEHIIYRVSYDTQEKIPFSPSDVYVDNTTWDFDEHNQGIRVTCDIWHIQDDIETMAPLKGNFIVKLLNPLNTFEREERPQ